MGTEVELKLCLADKSLWEQLINDSLITDLVEKDNLKKESYEANYYDTAGFKLKKAGFAYRIRREGEKKVATIKRGGSSEGGLHQREEWNKSVEIIKPDLKVFADAPFLEEILNLSKGEKLKKMFTTRFKRSSVNLKFPDDTIIEFAADQGEVIAGKKKELILEIELELIKGNIITLLKFAADLAKKYPLLLESRSKYYRGLMLAGIEADEDSYQVDCQINKEVALQELIHSVLISNLQSIIKVQDAFLQDPQNPETLHQIRVKIRYLRSSLSFFKPLINEKEYLFIQDSLRNLSHKFSLLREADVINNAWYDLLQNNDLIAKENSQLREMIIKIQSREKKVVLDFITKGALTPIILDIWVMLLQKPFKEGEIESYTFRKYFNYRITDWTKKLRKLGRNSKDSDYNVWHNIRIQIKKTRYVMQEFSPLLKGIIKKDLKYIKAFQELLGNYNDIYRHRSFLTSEIINNKNEILNYEAGVLLGWEAAKIKKIEKNITKDWDSISEKIFSIKRIKKMLIKD